MIIRLKITKMVRPHRRSMSKRPDCYELIILGETVIEMAMCVIIDSARVNIFFINVQVTVFP